MRFFVLTDLEGVGGVHTWRQVGVGECAPDEYARARSWLAQEVNAAVMGVLEAQAGAEIVVWDGHGPGGVNLAELHPEARLIPRGAFRPPYTFDRGYDGLLVIGQHARAGSGGLLCHTYSLEVYRYWLNGREIGELGLRSFLAGLYDIPVLLVTGDDVACREARELIPNVVTCPVKETIHSQLAYLRPPAACQALIRQAASAAVGNRQRVPPLRLEPPYAFRAQYLSSALAETFVAQHPEAARIDAYTIEVTGPDLLEVIRHVA